MFLSISEIFLIWMDYLFIYFQMFWTKFGNVPHKKDRYYLYDFFHYCLTGVSKQKDSSETVHKNSGSLPDPNLT